jgi:hypothetical protein
MEVSEIFDRVTDYVAVASVLGMLLLLPLYLSQRRDVVRLREWREREPDHPAADVAASEALLDRAEAELEELLGPDAEPEPDTGATPSAAYPAATRVTHERPALERITMERAALAPHPRWRRFVNSATQPRVLVAVALGALVLGVGGIFVSEALLQDGGNGGRQGAGAIDPADVTVAVLNGSGLNGLGSRVSDDVTSAGFTPGVVTATDPGVAKTVVLYADGQKPAAQKVARKLGVDEELVEPMDRETRRLADGADVAVIAGEDRAS